MLLIFKDAASFESALNDGEMVNGKIVQFDVIEYEPDSALGINCWSGEHLNFISEDELNVKKGDIVVGLITKEPSKTFFSWKIPYEVIEIKPDIGDKEKTEIVQTEIAEETTEIEITTMPYNSNDYENGDWSLEEVVSHLEELGFEDIEVVKSESRYVSEENLQVLVEDFSSDSWFTEYKDFEQGEPLHTWRKVKIEVTIPIPVLTEENSPELVSNLAMRYGSDGDVALWESFMKEHNGEYIEFDGVVTDVYDEFWFASGISLSISFEEYEDIDFGWSGIEPNDIGYDNDFSSGCLSEGTPAHCIVKIVYTDEECYYELESLELGDK